MAASVKIFSASKLRELLTPKKPVGISNDIFIALVLFAAFTLSNKPSLNSNTCEKPK